MDRIRDMSYDLTKMNYCRHCGGMIKREVIGWFHTFDSKIFCRGSNKKIYAEPIDIGTVFIYSEEEAI